LAILLQIRIAEGLARANDDGSIVLLDDPYELSV
jgi:hypothetical protein